MFRCVPLIFATAIFCLAQDPIAPHSAWEPPAAKGAASLAASSKDSPRDLLTTGEKTDWNETASYAEAVEIAHRLERASRFVKVLEIGTTPEGRTMIALVVSKDRAFTPEALAHAKAGLLALAGRGDVCSPVDGYPCEVKVEMLTECRAWPRNPGTDGLYELWKQAADELGLAVNCEERGGLSDGNLIWDAVPTLDGLGPWGDNDHCSERSADGAKLPEFVDASTFVPKARLNFAAIQRLCGA